MKDKIIAKFLKELKEYDNFCQSLISERFHSAKHEDSWMDDKVKRYYTAKSRIDLLIEIINDSDF